MNKSNDASQIHVGPNATQAALVVLPVDIQPDSPKKGDITAWLARVIPNMKRMHQDEAYRKEIAKKLS